ncbi:MAG: hypothetical protein R3B82_11290 [Sandaracinaceae bacterium]
MFAFISCARRFAAGLTLLFALSSLSLIAAAQDADAPDERVERARALFEQAEADFAQHLYPAAATGYQQSYELLREAGRATAPLVLYNVGLAWERAQQRDMALEAYRRFVADAVPEDPETQRRVADAQARITVLDRGTPPPRTDTGPPPPEQTDESETRPAAVSTTAGSTSSDGGGGISPVGPILMAAGGALVVVGLILDGVALGRDGDFEAMCPNRTGCDPALRSQWDETITFAAVGDAMWIGGAVVAATGLVLTFVLTEGGDDSTAALSCGPGGCTVRGSF